MKKLLLALLLVVVAYFSFEFVQGRDPLEHLANAFRELTENPQPQLAQVAVPAPTPEVNVAPPPVERALVLAAPPRDSAEEGVKRFGPIAEYLSQLLGRKVVYSHPTTWGGYQSDMQKDAYDLAFDGPHFVSWRVENLAHNVLVKLPGEPLYIVAFVRRDNTRIQSLKQLAGQPVCAHAPPNLGTLMLLRAFDNPSRQPKIVVTEGFDKIYTGVLEGKCVAGIVPKKNLVKKDKDSALARVIYEHPPFPEQAFTAGPRLSVDEQAEIAVALMRLSAEIAFQDFREAYALKGPFVRASNTEYTGFGVYLKPVQGF